MLSVGSTLGGVRQLDFGAGRLQVPVARVLDPGQFQRNEFPCAPGAGSLVGTLKGERGPGPLTTLLVLHVQEFHLPEAGLVRARRRTHDLPVEGLAVNATAGTR
jgi:hypothetical protein